VAVGGVFGPFDGFPVHAEVQPAHLFLLPPKLSLLLQLALLFLLPVEFALLFQPSLLFLFSPEYFLLFEIERAALFRALPILELLFGAFLVAKLLFLFLSVPLRRFLGQVVQRSFLFEIEPVLALPVVVVLLPLLLQPLRQRQKEGLKRLTSFESFFSKSADSLRVRNLDSMPEGRFFPLYFSDAEWYKMVLAGKATSRRPESCRSCLRERTIDERMEVRVMTSLKKAGILLLGLGLLFVLVGTPACQKKAAESPAAPQPQKPSNEFEGTVKTAVGKYLYLPTAQGFDIVLQGFDAATLVGKDIRVKGELLLDKPSIFRADTVDVKGASGAYTNAFTRTQDLAVSDFLDVKARELYPVLTITGVNKPEEWENKGKGKVFGKLQEATVKEGGAETPVTYIVLTDDKGKEAGKIIADKFSEFSRYYLKKLRLFDKFWFYLNIKDSVDKKVRPRTKELFHADVQFAGLF
jgi:hypothetical protein